MDEWKDDKRGHGVRDESRDDEDQTGEDDEDGIEGEAFDFIGDCSGNGMKKSRGVDRFPEGETTGCQNDNCP